MGGPSSHLISSLGTAAGAAPATLTFFSAVLWCSVYILMGILGEYTMRILGRPALRGRCVGWPLFLGSSALGEACARRADIGRRASGALGDGHKNKHFSKHRHMLS